MTQSHGPARPIRVCTAVHSNIEWSLFWFASFYSIQFPFHRVSGLAFNHHWLGAPAATANTSIIMYDEFIIWCFWKRFLRTNIYYVVVFFFSILNELNSCVYKMLRNGSIVFHFQLFAIVLLNFRGIMLYHLFLSAFGNLWLFISWILTIIQCMSLFYSSHRPFVKPANQGTHDDECATELMWNWKKFLVLDLFCRMDFDRSESFF